MGGKGREKTTLITEREAKEDERVKFVMECRRKCEAPTMKEVREAEARIGHFMELQFANYVPLRYHLMKFQENNIMRQHSELTPADELSIYNFFTRGDGQSEEQMLGIAPRAASSAAKAREDSCSEEE